MENLNIFFFFLLPESKEIPDDSKHRPGHVEWGAEAEEGPGPGQLYRRGEEVLEEPVLLPALIRPQRWVNIGGQGNNLYYLLSIQH